ncbi:Protein of unknown function [Desulfuromusa kysingii]|uniref:Putative Se/S carrier protein-like domain-containing protein n=1 Tax=Desulfuromusa kysingii TaxID=37625 RepID=A0A1H3ZJJ5_9BACT|nr:DUF3343 domain-containing protein [Desulfuromusa kysingii]SEA23956.1 Protein of unknown function [Desulfuromusa kysingii]
MHGLGKRVIMRGWTLRLGWWLVIDEGDCVAIFHSIHRVMKAEKVLKDQHLDVLLVPVPRSLSADCGMVVRYPRQIQTDVLRTLAEAKIDVIEVWLRQDGKYLRQI